MPRRSRERSVSGIYHVMVRGVNKQAIFVDNEDYRWYLEILKELKESIRFDILAYCLMPNHVHLTIRVYYDNLSQIMRRLGTRYAIWFNLKHERTGHLFQDRFRSEKVETDGYLLVVVRYIHLNPVKAQIVDYASEYPWSSHRTYLGEKGQYFQIVDTDLVLNMFSSQGDDRRKQYKLFLDSSNDDRCLDINVPENLTDDEVFYELTKLLNNKHPFSLRELEKQERDKVLQEIKEIKGISIRQIAKITGLDKSLVSRA